MPVEQKFEIGDRVACYWVRFDELTDDGSGDGPYGAAVIDAASLRPLV